MKKNNNNYQSAMGEILLYQTEDGLTEIQLKAQGDTVWLTQAEIAELFQTSTQNITLHIKSIYKTGELTPTATCKDYLQVRHEGERQIQRVLLHYNLDVILAVGYRVRSQRGIQFRQWASTNLKEYLVKGFILNDQRLKNPGDWDYFDELLERIRAIRASEKRFYQKIRDIYSTSVDYNSKSQQAQLFFKTVQNKILWAVTGKTAAELLIERANPNLPNMGLTTWQGHRVYRADIIISKNYLTEMEIKELDRIVSMFLDYAEDQARQRKTMSMKNWEERLDSFLRFNERKVLNHAGSISHEHAEEIVNKRYDLFDVRRRNIEKIAADNEYLQELAALEKEVANLKKGGT